MQKGLGGCSGTYILSYSDEETRPFYSGRILCQLKLGSLTATQQWVVEHVEFKVQRLNAAWYGDFL